MKYTPLVSIVIPVYNSAKTIEETMNSVKSQTYSNWEIVCVDDGSSDASISIIKEMSMSESRIRLCSRSRQPKGGSTCRNIGAKEAKGDYLIFLDSDDLLASNCLENRVRAIEGTNNNFVVFPMATFNDGEPWNPKQPHNIHVVDYDYLFASAISAWPITSPIIRRKFFLNLGGFDERFPRLQDVEFHLRAITASYGQHIIESDTEADCFYRLSPRGYSLSKLKVTCVAYKMFVALLVDLLESDNLRDKKKLSNSLILLFSNISLIKHSLWSKGEDISAWNDILVEKMRVYINKRSWRLIKLLNRPYNSRIMALFYFYLGRTMVHLCLNSFKTK